MWAGLDNFDTFASGVDQLFIVTIELIATRGGFKACFILKVKQIDLADARIGSFILLLVFWSFLHDGSRIKSHDRSGACLGVDVQHHCFREGAFGGAKRCPNGVSLAKRGQDGLALILFVIF